MVAGGTLFAWSALRNGGFPRYSAVLLFAGCCVNLALALVPAADPLQTGGSALRNAGLIAMGYSCCGAARKWQREQKAKR